MRKMTVEYPFESLVKLGMGPIFQHIVSIEMLEMLHIDVADGKKMGVFRLRMRSGEEPGELFHPMGKMSMTVLERNDDDYVVMMEAIGDVSSFIDLKRFPDGVIWSRPSRVDEHGLVMSVIAPEDSLKAMIDFLSYMGTPTRISMGPARYHASDMLSLLTDKQREVLDAAVRMGYYEFPRRIDGDGLGEITGVRRSTALYHLRNAEARLIKSVFGAL